MKQCLAGHVILLAVRASNDRIPSGKEVSQVLVDELNRQQVVEIINDTVLDVRTEVLVHHQ